MHGGAARAVSAGAALRTTAEEMVRAGRAQPAPGTAAGAALPARADDTLRAGRAQPAPGAARALRAVSILLLWWEGVLRWRFDGGDRRALERPLWLGAGVSTYVARWRGLFGGRPAAKV